MNMKNKLYIIDGKTYLNHINDEVHLYGLLHQLTFLAGRIKDEADMPQPWNFSSAISP